MDIRTKASDRQMSESALSMFAGGAGATKLDKVENSHPEVSFWTCNQQYVYHKVQSFGT